MPSVSHTTVHRQRACRSRDRSSSSERSSRNGQHDEIMQTLRDIRAAQVRQTDEVQELQHQMRTLFVGTALRGLGTVPPMPKLSRIQMDHISFNKELFSVPKDFCNVLASMVFQPIKLKVLELTFEAMFVSRICPTTYNR